MILYPALAAAAAALMTFAWWVVRRRGDGGWTDVVWSFAVGLVGALAALWPAADAAPARQLLVAALVGGWALRLGGHLAARTAAAQRPDPRYERLMAEWGGWGWAAWRFLMIQAAVILVLAVSIRAAAVRPGAQLDGRDGLAALVVLLAVGGEWLADRQLAAFRRQPGAHGRVMDSGLWAWSRHPNYFFEWLVWLSWPVMALSPAVPASWLTLAAPILMWWLLNHVSGVPMLEAQMLRSRPRAFRDYQARVSRFFPLPPKRP
jgi:steroid 5-alpha reductase family enzyme